jgi:hypothetical protein
MTTPKGIDRKDFMAGVAAWAAMALSGCSDDGDGGGTDAGGGTATGGTTAGGSGGGAGMTGGSSTGGSGGAAMTLMCSTNTFDGDHSHPLTIPEADVEAIIDEGVYSLEDGGTGHTHTLTLTAYDYVYLKAADPITRESSTDVGHSHMCTITCLYT